MTTDIDGTWLMVRAELDGEVAPGLVVAKSRIEFAAGRYEARYGSETGDRGTFVVGVAGDHGTLQLEVIAGPNRGRNIPCIFQRRGDRLRVCFGLDGVAPADFSTAPGQQRYLVTYRLQSDSG
jgi:uncharacterized protein (TIGR03067 family)